MSAAWAVGGYLLVRVLAVAMLGAWGAADHRSLLELLGHRSDAAWYLDIMEHGYDNGPGGFRNLAFFPLYPFTARAVAALSPLGPDAAAIATAWVAGAAAAWGLYVVGSRLRDPATGVVLAVLWGVIPHAVTESMAYSESLFTALAAWTLACVLAERWLTAGLLCLLGGLSRPNAPALVATVVLAAGAAAVGAVRWRRSAWRPGVAALLAPLGWLGYLAWVGHRVHRADGWFHIQKSGWGSSWDGGGYTLAQARTFLTTPSPLGFCLVTLVLALAITLLALAAADRQPWPLLLFSALLLAITLGGEGFYTSKARFLVAAFPLLLQPATALAHARRGTTVLVLAFLTLTSGYLGGYLLLVWNHSP